MLAVVQGFLGLFFLNKIIFYSIFAANAGAKHVYAVDAANIAN